MLQVDPCFQHIKLYYFLMLILPAEDEHDVDHAAWLSDKESESEAKDTGRWRVF